MSLEGLIIKLEECIDKNTKQLKELEKRIKKLEVKEK